MDKNKKELCWNCEAKLVVKAITSTHVHLRCPNKKECPGAAVIRKIK